MSDHRGTRGHMLCCQCLGTGGWHRRCTPQDWGGALGAPGRNSHLAATNTWKDLASSDCRPLLKAQDVLPKSGVQPGPFLPKPLWKCFWPLGCQVQLRVCLIFASSAVSGLPHAHPHPSGKSCRKIERGPAGGHGSGPSSLPQPSVKATAATSVQGPGPHVRKQAHTGWLPVLMHLFAQIVDINPS